MGEYIVNVSKNGYKAVQETLELDGNPIQYHNLTIRMLPEADEGKGNLKVTVRDFLTLDVVTPYTVYIREGINNLDGEIIQKMDRKTWYYYTAKDLPVGHYCLEFANGLDIDDHIGYYADVFLNVVVTAGKDWCEYTTYSIDWVRETMIIVLTCEDGSGKVTMENQPYYIKCGRIDSPSGQYITGIKHTWRPREGMGVMLAYDYQLLDFRYYVSMPNEDKEELLKTSEIKMQIYTGGKVKTIYMPEGEGEYWNPFSYDTESGMIQVINQICDV